MIYKVLDDDDDDEDTTALKLCYIKGRYNL
jgi:hypothetical protein